MGGRQGVASKETTVCPNRKAEPRAAADKEVRAKQPAKETSAARCKSSLPSGCQPAGLNDQHRRSPARVGLLKVWLWSRVTGMIVRRSRSVMEPGFVLITHRRQTIDHGAQLCGRAIPTRELCPGSHRAVVIKPPRSIRAFALDLHMIATNHVSNIGDSNKSR